MRIETGEGNRDLLESPNVEIARLDLTYIYNAGFAEEILTPGDALSLLPQSSMSQARGYPSPTDRQPDYFYDIHSQAEPPIKEAAVERRLFYAYNYLKWRAATLRDELMVNPQHPQAAELTAHIRQHAEAAVKMEDYLFRANMALLVHEAHNSPERYSDGAIALLKAIRKFNSERGTRFSTLAVRSIQHAIWRGWRVEQRSREIPHENLSDVVSPGFSHEEVIEELDRQELLGIVLEALMSEARLSRRERDMLELHYGVNLLYEETMVEIAEKFGITRSRVGQILAAALQKMKKAAELRPISRDNL